MMTTIPAISTLSAAPTETRQALVDALLEYAAHTAETAAAFSDDLFPFRPANETRLRSARCVLGLDMDSGAEATRRVWLTHSEDVHPGLRALHTAVTSGEWSPNAPTPTLTAEGDAKARDRQANALAVMRRREAMALADRQAAEQQVRDQAARIAALEEQLRGAAALHADAVARSGASVPWGPSHPDWLPFWRQAAADAEAAGNCSEYDRHAREMGGPERSSLRYDGTGIAEGRVKRTRATVSVQVVVTATVDIEYDDDNGYDRNDVENALDGYSEGDYSYDRIHDWETVESESIAGDGGAYWNNPESDR